MSVSILLHALPMVIATIGLDDEPRRIADRMIAHAGSS
jgi:hypothetical protein